MPVFPSKTFPNHYTLVTGLHAESHGIVSNRFWSPEFNELFDYTNDEVSSQSRWWLGEPVRRRWRIGPSRSGARRELTCDPPRACVAWPAARPRRFGTRS